MPLTSHVPAKAPTKNKIRIGTKTLFKFSQISFPIKLKDTLLNTPTIAAMPPPISNIIWLV